jgi:5'-3' exoribonuclease 2
VSIARPRRLVYLAIDGVAPRAKMNQQRSRRFRAAREAEQKAEVHAKLKQEWLARGLKLPPKLKGSQEEWDSNVITVRLTQLHMLAEEAVMQTRRDVYVFSCC